MTFRSILPNTLTMGNLFCGYLAIVQTYNDNYATAALLILLASVFDALDGKVARWTKSTSEFGAELDSICDVVSFGIAPSILIYRHEFSAPPLGMPEFVAVMIAFLPALGGAFRLARFNVAMRAKAAHKKFFIGMPIPAAANTISAYILFSGRVYNHPVMHGLVPVLVATIAVLMVSRVHFEALPQMSWNQDNRERIKLVMLLIALVLFVVFREIVFFPLMLFYLLSGLVQALIVFLRPAAPTAGGVVT